MEVEQGLELICDAPPLCFNATRNLRSDPTCDNARNNFSAADPSFVCNGTCRAMLDDVVTECGNVSALFM